MTNAAGEPVHFPMPFRRGADGKVATVVQDTPEHHLSQVQTVVRYPLGYRDPEKPGFGIPWPDFASAPVKTDAIQAAIDRQVPNADVSLDEYADLLGPAFRTLEVDVS